MHKKNNFNKNKNYIQGLRPIANLIPKDLKRIIKKGGYNFNSLVDKWTVIVGKEISSCSYPIDLKIGRDLKNGTVFLNVQHGKEVDIEYNKKNIIDKINSFFGYNYINKINLKIIQEKQVLKKTTSNKNKRYVLKEKQLNISNIEFRKKIENLVKAYNENDK